MKVDLFMTINIKIMNIFKISVLHPDLDHSEHSQRCLFDWLFTVAPKLSLAIDNQPGHESECSN